MTSDFNDQADLEILKERVRNWRSYPEIVKIAQDDPELASMLDTPGIEEALIEFIRYIIGSQWT